MIELTGEAVQDVGDLLELVPGRDVQRFAELLTAHSLGLASQLLGGIRGSNGSAAC
ncbi:MAG: hypothetical protein R2991_14090 [Thermoanaerobaculia bacterium]